MLNEVEQTIDLTIRQLRAALGPQAVILPFAAAADTLVAADCAHPSGTGHQVISVLSSAAFLAAQ